MDHDFAEKWRVKKACARCHRLKIKCVYEDPSYKACRRCFNQNLACSVEEDPTAPTAKKRHLLPTERVARQVSRLDKAVAELGLSPGDLETLKALVWREQAKGAANPARSLLSLGAVLEQDLAQRYRFFHEHMAPFYPAVAVPQQWQDFDYAVEQCPVLVLACAYVTASTQTAPADPPAPADGEAAPQRQGSAVLLSTAALLSTALASTALTLRDSSPRPESGVCGASGVCGVGQALERAVHDAVASTVYIRATDFSPDLALACLILSLWGTPKQKGQFHSQVCLIAAHTVLLCVDLPSHAMLGDTNSCRVLLALFCCLGSIAFSLPRFQLVSWSPAHDRADAFLAAHPAQADTYLCRYSRLIRLGQDLCTRFLALGASMAFITSTTHGQPRPAPQPLSLRSLVAELDEYRAQLQLLVAQFGLFASPEVAPLPSGPLAQFALVYTYNHVLMLAHDNLVSWCFHKLVRQKQGSKADVVHEADDPTDLPCTAENKRLLLDQISRFNATCENILDSFVMLSRRSTVMPTFFYFRALAALVSLLRLQILSRSEYVVQFLGVHPAAFKLQQYYSSIADIILAPHAQLQVGLLFHFLVKKIGRWVAAATNGSNIDYIELTTMSKGQELEKMSDPAPQDPAEDPFVDGALHDIFRDIDNDVLRFLNPFDQDLTFANLFTN